MKLRRYTDEERAFLAEFIPGHLAQEVADEFNERFAPPIKATQVAAYRKNHKLHSGRDCRFKDGSGGFKSEWHRQRFLEGGANTRFKKGNMPHNGHQPIGTERVDAKNGHVYVKVAERKTDPKSAHDNWRAKHHLVYEQHHGAIPEGHNVVFADHDKLNFDPANLVAVPRKLWATLQKMGLPYHDAESLEAAMNLARLKQAKYSAQTRPRACTRCGEEFKPRFAKQRKCDKCIKFYGTGRK